MRPINQCLNPQLTNICQKALQLELLQNKIIPLLPEAMQSTCKVGSFNQGCLVLTTQDSVWASQLRYMLPELRDKLRQAGFYQLSSVKVMLKTDHPVSAKKPKKNENKISVKAREIILSQSEQCTHEPLKKALENLAKP